MGNAFGWGIVGLNLFCHWANDPKIRPVMGRTITEGSGLCDPLTVDRVREAVAFSNQFLAKSKTTAKGKQTVDAVLIDSLGNGFPPTRCHGTRSIARCIFEDTDLAGARAALERYDALLVASQWNARLLARATDRKAKVIYEGVDPSLFCPGPKSGRMDPGKFYIFSGGKVEFRKGQDLVLLAFKRFHARHRDSMLVTAWHSPWPQLGAGFQGRSAAAVRVGAGGALDITKWIRDNGIEPDAAIDIGFVLNPMMPAVLREMDVALQPSRAEACTNLSVKEAMACGVPVIAAFNTGMKDLLTDENAIVLRQQAEVRDRLPGGTEEWGESDVDEMVAALEFAYEHRERAREIGRRSRTWLIEHGRTWQAHAAELKRWILARR